MLLSHQCPIVSNLCPLKIIRIIICFCHSKTKVLPGTSAGASFDSPFWFGLEHFFSDKLVLASGSGSGCKRKIVWLDRDGESFKLSNLGVH